MKTVASASMKQPPPPKRGGGRIAGRSDSHFVAMPAALRFTIVAVTLALALGVGVVNVAQQRVDLLLVFGSLVLYLGVLLAPIIFYQPGWGIFHPLVFTVLWAGLFKEFLRRIPLYAYGLEYHEALPGYVSEELSWVLAKSLLLSSLGFVALYVGYLLGARPPVPLLKMGPPRFLFLKTLLIAAIATTALWVLARYAGGIERLVFQRALPDEYRVIQAIGGHWHVLAGILTPACLLWLALKPRVVVRPHFVALLLLSLAIGYITTGSRSAVITPLIFVVIIWSLQRRKLPYGAVAALALAGIVGLGVMGQLRYSMYSVESLNEVELAGVRSGFQAGLETLVSYSGQYSGQLGIAAKVPGEVDLLYGASYLAIPAAPIPRALWPGKPMAGGRITAERIFEYGDSSIAMPPGMIGEAYFNFHLPGVLLVMGCYGIFLRWLADLVRKNARMGWILAFYPLTLFTLRPASDPIYVWLHSMVPFLFVLVFFCGFPRRRAARTWFVRKRGQLDARNLLESGS